MKKSIYAVSLVVFLAIAVALPALAATNYFQGFETDTTDWSGASRVLSGTNSVDSAAGAFHAEVASGAFTRFGSYETPFPAGGYKTSVDIYLEPSTAGYANDMRFDWDSAINDASGNFRRDFIFNAGFYNDADATGTGARFVVSASNNSSDGSAYPKNPDKQPIAITAPGWYTFEHKFSSSGGVLSVEMNIINESGGIVKTWTLSDATDLIGITVGGHRYGWFVHHQFPNLAIDNVRLSSAFNFTGFFEPVNNGNIVNTVKAGSAIPVKFSLSGDQGLTIFDGNPEVHLTNCGTAPTDPIEITVPAGNSSLSYDPVTDQYTYVWKTDKSWKGQCGTLVLYLSDGTQHTALFQFK